MLEPRLLVETVFDLSRLSVHDEVTGSRFEHVSAWRIRIGWEIGRRDVPDDQLPLNGVSVDGWHDHDGMCRVGEEHLVGTHANERVTARKIKRVVTAAGRQKAQGDDDGPDRRACRRQNG